MIRNPAHKQVTPASVVSITVNERDVLKAIVRSEYQNGDKRDDVVDHAVWASYCNPFKTHPKSYGGVLVSLVRKGLVKHHVDPSNANYSAGCDGSTVEITAAGWDALEEAKHQSAAFDNASQ